MKLARALGVFLALAIVAPAAHGAVITQIGGPASGTNGIALGPDGNLWVASQYAGTVTRMTPSGSVLGQFAVGAEPRTVTNGPGGRIWVGVNGANKLTWFDSTSSTPAAHDIALPGNCGPEGLVSAPDGRMYFSCDSPVIGWVKDDGTGAVSTIGIPGAAYALAISNGKLFAPDYNGDVIRRLSLVSGALPPTVESTITAPAGSNPDGISADGKGSLWVTANGTGQLLRFAATQQNGAATTFTPTGGTLSSPFGVVVSTDGHIYVAATANHTIGRFTPGSGTTPDAWAFYPTPPDTEPFSIIDGPAGDLYVTDQNRTSLLRLVNRAPTPGAATLTAPAPTSLTATTTVDLGGNETTVTFEYGTTTAYGSASSATILPTSGAANLPAAATLTGLQPGTAYHVRVRATNAEGTVFSPDAVLQTTALPPTTITGAKFSSKSFRVAKGKKGGSTLSIALSGAGSVTGVITQKAKGVKKKSKCVAPPHRKKKGQKSCTRVLTKGTLQFGTLQAGTSAVTVTGKVGTKSLPAGNYTLTLAVGTSTSAIPFTIKK